MQRAIQSKEYLVRSTPIAFDCRVSRLSPSDWKALPRAPEDECGSRVELHRPGRILVIEDDLLIASEIEETLAEVGFDIVGVAATGEEALRLAETRAPDFAVIDISLAGDRDGIDTALELFRLHGIRCIFASAYSDREARRRAEEAAPFGWLQKPYSMGSLKAMARTAASELRNKGGAQ